MIRSKDGPKTRRGDHLHNVRAVLERWRFKTKRDRYSLGSVTAEVVLPNPTLTTLASNAYIRTLEDLDNILNPPWVMGRRHGAEVLTLLRSLDEAERALREQTKQAKVAERKEATQARQAEKKRQADAERAKRKQEKADAKVIIMQEQANRKAQREADRSERKRERAAIQAAKPKRAARVALAGSSVFNVGTSTPPSTHSCSTVYDEVSDTSLQSWGYFVV